MKFLSPLATKNDVNELTEALKIHGKGNVILFKQHRIKLISPLWQSLLSIVLLAIIFYIIHANYYEGHEEIYWSLTIFYMATTITWVVFVIICILKNIWKILDKKNMYYEDVESLTPGKKWYDVFSIWSGVILLFHLIFVIYNFHVPFTNRYNGEGLIAAPIVILALDIFFLGDILVIMDKLLLYELTFYLCTPDSLKLFIQTGFLSVDVAEISPASINIIKFDKDGLFATLFHYGNIYIFTDSEVRIDLGSEITLEDIPEPEIMVKRIYKIYDRKFPTE